MSAMTRTPIFIPCTLDHDSIMSVLGQLNLLKTGAKEFGQKEIYAALKWARVPPQVAERFLDAVQSHGLLRQPEPVPARVPWRMPVAKKAEVNQFNPEGKQL